MRFFSHISGCINTFLKYLCIPVYLIFCSFAMAEESDSSDPRLEIGIGASTSSMQSRPAWSSKTYTSGIVSLAYRLVYGLSLHGTQEYFLGKAPDTQWIDYGDNFQINTAKGSYREAQSLGARYEIPLSKIKKDFVRIHSVYVGGGMLWDTHNVLSKYQRETQDTEPDPESVSDSFKVADLTGYYVTLAARWRITTSQSENEDSRFGSYGIDAGFRYARYPESTTKYSNTPQANSNFSYFQIFIMAIVKFRFFY